MRIPGFNLRNWLPRTLFARSLMILVIPVLLIQVVTTYVFFERHWSRMTDRLAFAVAGEIGIIAGRIEEAGDHPDPERIEAIAGYAAQNLDLLVTFEEGQALEGEKPSKLSKTSFVAQTLTEALDNKVRRNHIINIDVEEKWIEVSLELKTGVLRVSLPQRRLFSSSGYIFLLWMIGVSIVLLAIAIFFMRKQIRPIRRLAVAAERFGRGLEVPSEFKLEGAKEVRQATKAFFDMQERIRRQVQQRTAMLAGVSHDLRTPLTRMKLQVAMLPRGSDVEELKNDINEMERMINAYLEFARGEGGEASSRIDLKQLLERLAMGAKRQSVNVNTDIDENLMLQGRPVAIERALSNIIGNARKFGKTIWLTAKTNEEQIQIVIEDDGPGVPEDKREDVFKPFYRVEESRNPETGGVGLGLPVAQDIIHSHGGNIKLDDSKHGGLCVSIFLPL